MVCSAPSKITRSAKCSTPRPDRTAHRSPRRRPSILSTARARRQPARQKIVSDRVQWLRAEMLKTRVAHGYCARSLVAEACSYANICEQCDNFTTSVEFIPALRTQLVDATALRDDAEARGWD